ncbi:sarcosine oxidase subunit alpha family protein [Sediminicurvatus halobius]|uniref:Sarcosine oxidase subunit alpha n=1 Tax=Sediminicurvatus halobius TaxID=2182432 RepID=A0A2U2N6A4_9GAMM|nr:sarcosine oxidase subunit alpha family protein [Spiribacter halobius]PWG64622.1 sarcosine oxidase subunit alpha [Spiribacter halobius]UEX79055.1 sarcosine oxidase subunit alpha family protein [Spiribacter halobius]
MTARLPQGGRIDRERPLAFMFNGERYQGYAGDTLASALLANDVHLVSRSIKLHRPRGIVGRGPEEPNALLQVGRGAAALPNTRATQLPLRDGLEARSVNGRPSVNTDAMAVFDLAGKLMPAGFYYKTFMAPRGWWERYERVIRPAAGTGMVPDSPDPDRYEKVETHCDVLVAGAGAAGLAAALAAARAGARVIIADEQAEAGGGLLASRARIDGQSAADWAGAMRGALEQLPEVRVLPATTVFGHYDHRFIGLVERVQEQRPEAPVRERFWRVRTRELVIAAGAIERPIAFPDNDRPGIMTASAVREYLERYAVRCGRRAVVFTNNDSAYATAHALLAADAAVTVVDARRTPGAAAEQAEAAGARVLPGSVISATAGRRRVRRVSVRAAEGGTQDIDCDLVAVSGGWNPSVHLHSHARGELRWVPGLASFVPAEDLPHSRAVGACRGTFDLAAAIAEGFAAGAEAARAAGRGDGDAPAAPTVTDAEPGPEGLEVLWRVPGKGPAFVDLQNDVKASDLELALREGYRSIEHVKRYSVLGFGTDQGKLGNLVGMGIVAEALGKAPEAVGTTTYRPAWTPVTFGALVGPETGELFQPIRRTPMHEWHEAEGAVFEDVGQWKRARYYPREGEDMDAAVARECLATHQGVGVLDYSTLGKIDIQGPDAVTLLERVYTNNWRKLAVGRCRYGLMLDENGMVLDDGVTARLGEQHYLMYTSTGGAARVLAWLERWLQTEWPELEVYLTSVTDAWATVSLAGPHSRDLLWDLGTDIPLEAEAFPFMSVRTGSVAGMPARVQRVSFSGELTFEVSVPANFGLDLWTRVMEAGERYGATPYGTETMHVLRAEKGFIIVGQDTDGSISPIDLGMDGLVSRKKDCLGKRSLQRPELQRADRPQWVGLTPEDPERVIPEGAQLVADPDATPPVPMHGWVTSSYYAARIGRSIALGFVNGGRERYGERLFAWDLDAGVIPLTVTRPLFFDAEGERQNV